MTALSIGGTAITATPAQLNYVAGVTSAIQTQLNAKEPTISAGTTGQYWRGDKSWQTLPSATDTWITTQTCSTDYALQSVGKTTKTCINKVDYSDVAYDVSCTNCLTDVEVASADSATDADKLDGYDSAEASTVSTVAVRNASGDINARLFKSEYDSTNATIGYIMTQIDTVSNNYIRPSTPAQVMTALGAAPKASPTFTGTVTVPTPTVAGAAATKEYVDSRHNYYFCRTNAIYTVCNDNCTSAGFSYCKFHYSTDNCTGTKHDCSSNTAGSCLCFNQL